MPTIGLVLLIVASTAQSAPLPTLRYSLSFRDGPKDQTSDAQLRIGESRDSQGRNCAP